MQTYEVGDLVKLRRRILSVDLKDNESLVVLLFVNFTGHRLLSSYCNVFSFRRNKLFSFSSYDNVLFE